MKKIASLLIAALAACAINAQTVVQKGNKWVQQNTRAKKDTLVTNQVYVYSDGTEYPIILDKSNGHCYIWKRSKKGKLYRVYFTGKNNENISISLCSKYGVKYIPPKKRK